MLFAIFVFIRFGNLTVRNFGFYLRLQNAEKKVVVVSIIGKSQYRAKGCKTEMLSSILLSGLLDDPTVDENTLV